MRHRTGPGRAHRRTPRCSQAAFEAAAASVKTFEPATPVTDDEKLKVYGLFKQANVGNVNTDRCVPRARWCVRLVALIHACGCAWIFTGPACLTSPARPSGTHGRRTRA